MTHFVRGAVTLALLAGCIGQARAGLNTGQGLPSGGTPAPLDGIDPPFTFTFTSNDGLVVVSGSLDAILNPDGTTYTATSGTATATIVNGLSIVTETLTPLIQNPNAPGASLSQSGYFIYDNQLLPGQNPLITNPGLLFRSDNGNEVNIFSNGPGPGTYQYYENNGFNTFGTFTLTAVPEPATFVMGGTALLVGLGYARIRRPKVAIA